MRLLDNYWAARPVTSGEVVGTYTAGHPEPSASQMFLTAWESSFLRQQTAFLASLHVFANNFADRKDTNVLITGMDFASDLQSGMTRLLPW